MNGRPTDWEEIFGELSDRFGWTPETIARLTYAQAKAYLRYIHRHPARYVYACDPPKTRHS